MASEKSSKPTAPTIAPNPGKIVESSEKSPGKYKTVKKNPAKKDS